MTLQNCPQVYIATASTFTLGIHLFINTVLFFELVLGMRSSCLPLILKSKKPFLKKGSHLSTWGCTAPNTITLI